MLPDFSNAISKNDHDFREPYSLCKDATCPSVDEYELFRYFYNKRFSKILVCNSWKNNLAKLIFLEVFVDVNLVKALIKSYNIATK